MLLNLTSREPIVKYCWKIFKLSKNRIGRIYWFCSLYRNRFAWMFSSNNSFMENMIFLFKIFLRSCIYRSEKGLGITAGRDRYLKGVNRKILFNDLQLPLVVPPFESTGRNFSGYRKVESHAVSISIVHPSPLKFNPLFVYPFSSKYEPFHFQNFLTFSKLFFRPSQRKEKKVPYKLRLWYFCRLLNNKLSLNPKKDFNRNRNWYNSCGKKNGKKGVVKRGVSFHDGYGSVQGKRKGWVFHT